MKIKPEQLLELNKPDLAQHNEDFKRLCQNIDKKNKNPDKLIKQLEKLQIAIPSWALGAGGTRFGRFSMGGEPANIIQKLDDIGIIHALTKSAGSVSLHLPWDSPNDYKALREKAQSNNIIFDAVNSNTFQDAQTAKHSYKFGSLSNVNPSIREQAISHNLEVIKIGEKLGSKSLTVWLADGMSFPGQNNFQKSLENTEASLKKIYSHLPNDWKMFIEYKPYEPNFYSTVIQDWGTSYMLANACGEKALTLVDLGHHLPNTNVEQIVATLMLKGKLGGFHFNDSKYGDDDLTVGCVKPYMLFLIFCELVHGMNNNPQNPELAWMIDASHNIKDPLEDLIQSIEAISEAYAKALLVDMKALKYAQDKNDVTICQEILQDAFRTDVRPLIQQSRLNLNGALHPIKAYRKLNIRQGLINERGEKTTAKGL